jgi:sensor c-di-GMP phosphodiesterase-like protein
VSLYQPIVDLMSWDTVGFEMLSRFPMPPEQRPDEVLGMPRPSA